MATTKRSKFYLVTAALLGIYAFALIAGAFLFHVDLVWLFYGLIPTCCGIFLSLLAYHHNTIHERHFEHHIQRIESNVEKVTRYVQIIAGVSEEFDQ